MTFLSPIFAYQIFKVVLALTAVSLIAIPFLRFVFPFRVAFQLIFSACGLIGAAAWGGFATHQSGENFFLYLAVFGVLSLFSAHRFWVLFTAGACLGGIFYIIGALLGGFIICPIIWIANIFNIIMKVLKGLFAEGGMGRRIVYGIMLCLNSITIADGFLDVGNINIFNPITQNIVKEVLNKQDAPINQSTTTIYRGGDTQITLNQGNVASVITLVGDKGWATYGTQTIFGSESNLPQLTSLAAAASTMQFVLAPANNVRGQSVSWSISSCNTGDSDVETYINGCKLEKNAMTLYTGSEIELRTDAGTSSSMQVWIVPQ